MATLENQDELIYNKSLKNYVMSCRPDLEFLQKNIDSTVLERLEHVASVPFRRISYTEAVKILTTAIREKKKKFENSKVLTCT